MIKKIFIILIVWLLGIVPVGAFELDWSADDEIRQNYNPSKLEQEVLPGLPSVLNENPNPQPFTTPVQKTAQPQVQAPPKTTIETDYSSGVKRVKAAKAVKNDSYSAARIRKGTKFKVKSRTSVSDWNTSGAQITFVSTAPVTQRYVSVPIGATFKAEIIDSHQPNAFGNGGLLKIKANQVILNGSAKPIDAKVIRANDKKVFLNNIKGKRGYMRGMGRAVDKGQKFYDKSRAISRKLSNNPIGSILSPVPTVVGGVGYTLNLVVSPISAIWSKGDHITIPSGANYVIKLKEHAYIQ